MRLGLDLFLEKDYKKYIGKRIGLLTNMTGVNEKLIPTIDLFHDHPDIDLAALFGPEHGIRGDAKEGETVDSSVDPYTGVPVYSLYGASKKPSEEMMRDVDVIVFDLQDIGARYYTYIYSMAYVMEACAEFGKEFVVLDRPNPVSGLAMEGNLVEKEVRSFVGLYPIPNRHGMTVGELAQFFNHECAINCELTVVAMDGWKREMYYDETGLFWVSSSPNTTGLDMVVLYPGTCLVEGTNLSEGRGTTKPFEYIGAPYVDGYQLAKALNTQGLPGVIARPISFVPTYQKYNNEVCEGVQLHVVNRRKVYALKTGLTLLETVAEMYPSDFSFNEYQNGKYFFDLLAGTKQLREVVLKGTTERFLRDCEVELEQFEKQRMPYLLYK
ncbi:exo-beta-N-acetylmuramidase NamZ family protein [Pseudogracilibacillus auburnensis]|uniref:exo-beta-N-acetylmuramidase NamZ family protein n=1 Tax=Pseudogracilibacillus auburnensis TaxID=1494959 RepID=UPI001A96CFB2|nr:DUF1343 domain-containing protein [Pseudogracilibacillus auburnensis]MBO1005894.1 DUF1343 domain-containing protein [Pseudogracilibacillus auburnensis]